MDNFLFRIDIESKNYKKRFLSRSSKFLFSSDNIEKKLTEEMANLIIADIGIESWENIIKDGNVFINIIPLSQKTISLFDYVKKFNDVENLVDLAFQFQMKNNGSVVNFTKIGLISQGMSLFAALLTIGAYPSFPFCYDCILIDILLFFGFLTPIIMKRSADATRNNILYAIQESLFPEPKDLNDLKAMLTTFTAVSNRQDISIHDAIFLSFQKLKKM